MYIINRFRGLVVSARGWESPAHAQGVFPYLLRPRQMTTAQHYTALRLSMTKHVDRIKRLPEPHDRGNT